MANIANPNKAVILADAKIQIMEGLTLAQIAHKHGIGERTLDTWLHQLGDEYVELRQAWVDKLLMDAGAEIENSTSPMTDENGQVLTGRDRESANNQRLARARELWKRATWYAERRDQRYAAKTEHKQDMSLSITVNRGQTERVIDVITDELRNIEDKSLI